LNQGDSSIHTDGDVDKTIQIAGNKNIVTVTLNWFISNRIVSSIAVIVLIISLIWLSYSAYGWYVRKQILDRHLAVANDFLKIGQYEKAKAEYQKAFDYDKENTLSSDGLEIVKALEELENDTEPIENIRRTADRLLKQSPENPFVHLLLGHLYAYDDAAKAQQHYQKAISLDSSFAEAFFSLGVLLQKQGKDKEALDNFEKAVQHSEFSTPYLTNLAYLYFKTGQNEKSLEIYGKILRNDKFYILAYCEIANVYFRMKNFKSAVTYLNHALDKLNDPKISNLPENQGHWFFELYKKQVYVSSVWEKKYYVLQSLALTSERLGNPVKAHEYMNQAQMLGIDEQKAQQIKGLMKSENPD